MTTETATAIAMISIAATSFGWPGISRRVERMSAALRTIRTSTARATRPGLPTICVRFIESATNSSPVSAAGALAVAVNARPQSPEGVSVQAGR